MIFSETKSLEELADGWTVTLEEKTEDAGITYYFESVLYHREMRRHGFLWTKKGPKWVVYAHRFAGWLGMGSHHKKNVEYFKKLIPIVESS